MDAHGKHYSACQLARGSFNDAPNKHTYRLAPISSPKKIQTTLTICACIENRKEEKHFRNLYEFSLPYILRIRILNETLFKLAEIFFFFRNE